MSRRYKNIPEYTNIKPTQFFDNIVVQQHPVVLRDFAEKWPMVAKAKQSPQQFLDYLLSFYQGATAKMVVAPPNENKRFFYNQNMTDVNYLSGEERVDLFLRRLFELSQKEVFPAISMQNADLDSIFPNLSDTNKSSFFSHTAPRIWIGNEGIVSAHYDGSDNLACVVAGTRKFILFPPDQAANLYPGPLNFTPAGAPTSLVDLNRPDFKRFPKYSTALENAYSATLGPGDAIFIPMLWWHHVESLAKVNALMNYWWNGSNLPEFTSPSVIDSLNLAILSMRNLNQNQRNAWLHVFDHYLFQQGLKPESYIPEHRLGLLGKLDTQQVHQTQQRFINLLRKSSGE